MKNLSEVKNIIELSIELDVDKIELFDQINFEENDFEIDNFRFIKCDCIDEIMREELSYDEYLLGCFSAGFLSNVLGIDTEVIASMQKSEAFEAIGKLIFSLDKLDQFQEDYARLDGYGGHFAHYDHEERETTLNGIDYYYFRVN